MMIIIFHFSTQYLIIKKENFYEIETDVLEKFKYLIEKENLGSKLCKKL